MSISTTFSSRLSPLLALPLLACFACSSEEDESPEPSSPEAIAVAAGIAPSALLPRFGGQPVMAGPRVVEVLPSADGEVQAEVRDATGQPVANAELTVRVQGANGQPAPVALRYDPTIERYVGRAPEGTVLASGPVQVEVHPRGENVTVGNAPSVPVAPEPTHGGQVVLVGPQAPEVRVEGDRHVRVYVPTESGELPDGELYAKVPVQGGEPVRVELEFDDDEGCYVAELDDDVTYAPGPIELELEVDDVVHRGRVAQLTVAPPPTLGGDVVVVGDYSVEVAPVDGEIRATVYDRRGRPLEDRPPTIDVRVEGHPRPVRLRWNAGLGYYVAPAPPGVVVTAAPLRVEVRHHGHVRRGRVRIHGHGPHGHVEVRGPAAHVEVRAPAPRVEVRVNHPTVVVEVDDHAHPSSMHAKHRKHRKSRRRHGH